ncbi:hypothetical protein FRX31_014865 [Thalictrum thalictroides]|uniref:Secreted protein n=1 Tax=Thalictrum thalictroides TaxID=46969 RepID=A0A7J6WDU4_THATH|nr:hypothetical protein FRX31_014865 [Thalictrum thalictroides]
MISKSFIVLGLLLAVVFLNSSEVLANNDDVSGTLATQYIRGGRRSGPVQPGHRTTNKQPGHRTTNELPALEPPERYVEGIGGSTPIHATYPHDVQRP